MATSFSKQFLINTKKTQIDFVDIPINQQDLLAFICPFLIENYKSDKIVKKISKRLKAFLTELNATYVVKNDFSNGIVFLDHLHEPNEYHLGYSSKNKGKAVSSSKAATIFVALRNNRFARQGITITNEAHNVLLLVEGIGQDIMSDIIANVCRDIFADFTLSICKTFSIKTTEVEIEFYSESSKKWERKKANLPFSRSKIILIPNKLLSGGRAYSNRYNWFVSSNYLAVDILNGIKPAQPNMVIKMKDGTKKAIIKEIYKKYKKPKNDLITFVLQYPDSLEKFVEYAKINLPELSLDNLK